MKLETSIHLMNKGDFQGALKILIDLHRSDINQHQVGFTLGVCYYNMRLHEKAIKAFEKDLLTDANPARTHYMLAMIYEHRGKTKKALLHWRKFVATGKNDYMIKAAKAHLSVLESRK